MFRTYDQHTVLRILPSTEDDVQFLRDLTDKICEIMKFPGIPGRPVDAMCPPEDITKFKELIAEQGILVKEIIEDMGSLIRDKVSLRSRLKRQVATMNWNDYQRYDTIIRWMEKTALAHPTFTKLIDMGRSVEGRKLYVLKIGMSPLGDNTRAVWIDGGIHAREWISISTATYILQNLITNFTAENKTDCSDDVIRSVDWYIAPLLNPDGYEFTHTVDRLWRKNRRAPPTGSNCYGVDLNRNWGVAGYGVGASSKGCSDVYQGTAENSEPETQAIINTILKYTNNIRVYVTLHSYGQYWLTSWGYKNELPEDYDKLVNLGTKGATAIRCINPSRMYMVGSGAGALYAAGGASDDYMKAVAKIPYSFTIELPNEFTFVLDPSEIIPVGNEVWAAMKEMAGEAARHPLGPDPANF